MAADRPGHRAPSGAFFHSRPGDGASDFDFDFDLIAVPFRMRPGLNRLADGSRQLTPLAPGSALAAEKRAVAARGESRHSVPGFDAAPALAAIAERARAEGIAFGADSPLELAFEEDFVVLDGDSGTLPWLCVCTPSHWAPEDKLGLPLAAVHAPVADNELLLAASRRLVALATNGHCWERHVWTVSPSPRYDQHPRRQVRAAWPHDATTATTPAEFAARCYLRTEHQTFFPVPGTRQAVFTIRVRLAPLPEVVDTAAKARRLHDSLASMTEAVATYKGLADARPVLQQWLAGMSK